MVTGFLQAEATARHRVFLVDDHPVVRQGLSQLIQQEADLEVCGEAADIQQAMAGVMQLRPDVAVVDLALKDSSGLDLIKSLHSRVPEIRILVLSMYDEALYAERTLRAGAQGYLMKQADLGELIQAIRQVIDGEVYVSRQMATRLIQSSVQRRAAAGEGNLEQLSDREIEVLRLLGQGLSTRRIAEALHVSIKTVESHRANIMAKLKLKGAAELIRYAVRWADKPDVV